jgi:hypothetical protein
MTTNKFEKKARVRSHSWGIILKELLTQVEKIFKPLFRLYITAHEMRLVLDVG